MKMSVVKTIKEVNVVAHIGFHVKLSGALETIALSCSAGLGRLDTSGSSLCCSTTRAVSEHSLLAAAG